jgi:hypothetical protein
MASVDNIYLGYTDYPTVYSTTDLDQEEFFRDRSNNGFRFTVSIILDFRIFDLW